MASGPGAGLFDLGPNTPRGLIRSVRNTLLRDSEADLSEATLTPNGDRRAQLEARSPQKSKERPIRDISPQSSDIVTPVPLPGLESSVHNPTVNTTATLDGVAAEKRALLDLKLQVIQAFSKAFDDTAKQFAIGHTAKFARELAVSFTSLCTASINGQTTAPKAPTANEDTYAARLRRNLPEGHPRDPQIRPRARQHQQQGQKETITRDNDIRVFFRLHEGSPAWDKQPIAIRAHIAKEAKIDLSAIPQITKVKTGWAVTPADLGVQRKILDLSATLSEAVGATAVEPAQRWYTYVIPDCPKSFRDLTSGDEVECGPILNNEIVSQTGLVPIRSVPSRHSDPSDENITMIVSFLEKPKERFRLFSKSRWARLIDKPAPIPQCDNCWDFHPRRQCDRTSRCFVCGRERHDGACLTATQCANLNFYRAPGEDSTLDPLMRWPIPRRCVIAGDFNARHTSWQSSQNHGRGAAIADWARENDLALLNPPGAPTNEHGNTIDLAFSNIPLAEATIEDHLATSADHFTISISLPTRTGRIEGPLRRKEREPSEKWATKAESITNLLRSITNTRHGPPPAYTRKAVQACVVPTLLYGAEAWYPGENDEFNDGKSTRILHLIERMHPVYMTALRATVPLWKTTPLAALHRESGLPPLKLLFESHRRRFATRLRTLDRRHPLATRTDQKPAKRPSRLYRTSLLALKTTRPVLLPATPPFKLEKKGKEETTADFENWFDFLPKRDIVVFTDGSKTTAGVGYGFAIYRDQKLLTQGAGGLRLAEVFDAEVKGALEGLKRALNLTANHTRVHVCLDNLAVVEGLLGQPSDSSQAHFLNFQSLARRHGEVARMRTPTL
ncbi:hypothetical protein ACJ41O_013132 [Fusarium nematophilum]